MKITKQEIITHQVHWSLVHWLEKCATVDASQAAGVVRGVPRESKPYPAEEKVLIGFYLIVHKTATAIGIADDTNSHRMSSNWTVTRQDFCQHRIGA